MSLTYGLRGPRDLLEKVKRDATLLNDEVTSDRLFNFVVTGYSIIDWVENDPAIPSSARSAVEAMRRDQWIKVCGDLATASKHFILTTRKPITSEAVSRQGYACGGYGKGGFGVGEEDIEVLLTDSTSVSCLDFVTKVVDAWEQFFTSHGL